MSTSTMESHQHQNAPRGATPSALARGRSPEQGDLPSITVNEHKAVMAALRAGVDQLATLNDLLVHEGGAIWMKSARGNRKVSELFDVRGTPLEQPVSATDIQAFLLRDVLGCKTLSRRWPNGTGSSASSRPRGPSPRRSRSAGE